MQAKLELARTAKDGKPAIELIVRNAPADIRGLLDSLGIVPTEGMMGRRSLVCATPAELDAARTPLLPYFDKQGNWINR